MMGKMGEIMISEKPMEDISSSVSVCGRRVFFNFFGCSCSAVAVWDAHMPGAGADETDGPFKLNASR